MGDVMNCDSFNNLMEIPDLNLELIDDFVFLEDGINLPVEKHKPEANLTLSLPTEGEIALAGVCDDTFSNNFDLTDLIQIHDQSPVLPLDPKPQPQLIADQAFEMIDSLNHSDGFRGFFRKTENVTNPMSVSNGGEDAALDMRTGAHSLSSINPRSATNLADQESAHALLLLGNPQQRHNLALAPNPTVKPTGSGGKPLTPVKSARRKQTQGATSSTSNVLQPKTETLKQISDTTDDGSQSRASSSSECSTPVAVTQPGTSTGKRTRKQASKRKYESNDLNDITVIHAIASKKNREKNKQEKEALKTELDIVKQENQKKDQRIAKLERELKAEKRKNSITPNAQVQLIQHIHNIAKGIQPAPTIIRVSDKLAEMATPSEARVKKILQKPEPVQQLPSSGNANVGYLTAKVSIGDGPQMLSLDYDYENEDDPNMDDSQF